MRTNVMDADRRAVVADRSASGQGDGTAEWTRALHGQLFRYKRDINRVFGIGVEILNVARTVHHVAFEMQILATNGVVQAAKITGDRGKPLLALVEILTDLPKQIAPAVQELERVCAQQARHTAASSNIVWRYQQLAAGLLWSLRHATRSSGTAVRERSSQPLTKPSALAALLQLQPGEAPAGPEADNRRFVVQRGLVDLERLTDLLASAQRALWGTEQAVAEIARIGATARYMAVCLGIESAHLADGQRDFTGLAEAIDGAVDSLEDKLRAMGAAISRGRESLRWLAQGRCHEESGAV